MFTIEDKVVKQVEYHSRVSHISDVLALEYEKAFK